MKIHSKKKYMQFLSIFAAAVIALAGCSQASEEISEPSAESRRDSGQVSVETAVVEKGRLRDSIIGSGIIRGAQEAVIRPQTNGIIQQVNFDLGDEVDGQTPLLVLDSSIALLNYQQAQREYQSALADLESQQTLFNRGSVSQKQLNTAKSAADGAAARLRQARDAYENNMVNSPISGWIADKAENLVPGDSVSAGQQIARVVDLNRLRIQLAFGQTQIFLIRSGQVAQIRVSSPGEEIVSSGTVTAVAAGSDPSTGSWKVIVEFDNPRPDLLKSGMSAQVEIVSDVEQLRDIVPAAAILNAETNPSLFVVDGNLARHVSIDILDSYGERVAVRLEDGGDLEGMRVLTSGLTRVENGDRIAWHNE